MKLAAAIQNQAYRQLYQMPINSTKDDVIAAVSFLSSRGVYLLKLLFLLFVLQYGWNSVIIGENELVNFFLTIKCFDNPPAYIP